MQSYSILKDEGLIPKDVIFIQKAMENLGISEMGRTEILNDKVANFSWHLAGMDSMQLGA